MRRKILGLLLAALCGCAAEPDAPLTVMSFNIRYGTADDGENSWAQRREFVFDVIRDAAPDLVGLQEALRFQLDEIGEALPRFAEVGVGRDDGREAGEYAAILYDPTRFEVLAQGTFWFAATPEVPGSVDWGANIPRICTWARFSDRQTDRRFYLYNIHLDHQSQESREGSARLLTARIAERDFPDPIIVTGDFNAGESNPVIRYLAGNGEPRPGPRLQDSFRAIHPDAAVVGTFNGFQGTATGEKIDYVFVSDDWSIEAAAIVRTSRDGRYPSDHFPVMTTLSY
jgi:endonuclease/exonuclease/phosphatase family metal-dependent hydrolase